MIIHANDLKDAALVFQPGIGIEIEAVYKRVSIEDLPSGYFRERLLQMVIKPQAQVYVVAKPGYSGDWTAYIGWPMFAELIAEIREQDSTDYYTRELTHPQGVMRHGDKLSYQEAEALFPEIASCALNGYRL